MITFSNSVVSDYESFDCIIRVSMSEQQTKEAFILQELKTRGNKPIKSCRDFSTVVVPSRNSQVTLSAGDLGTISDHTQHRMTSCMAFFVKRINLHEKDFCSFSTRFVFLLFENIGR